MGDDRRAIEGAVLRAVRDTVAEVNPSCRSTIRLDSDLERDLGLDSLVRATLVVRVEQALHVELDEPVVLDAATPRDIVTAALAARPVAPAALPAWEARQEPAPTLPPEVTTVTDALAWHAGVHPERVHVHLLPDRAGDPVARVTYGQLALEAGAVAAALRERDVRAGDTVALMLPTSASYFTTFTGVLRSGAVPVPLYPPTTARHLEDYLQRQRGILENAHASMLVTTPDAQRIARLLRPALPALRHVLTIDALAHHDTVEAHVPVQGGDLALVQYTSGSTGSPKGVMLTHDDLLANIRAMVAATHVGPDDVFVSWLPLYHDMGLIGAWLGSLCTGFPLVVMSPGAFLSRPARWLHTISDHAATLTASPNFGFELCLRNVRDDELEGLNLSSLRWAFNGAEPVAASTLTRFHDRFARCGLRPDALAPVYGLAEAGVGLAFPPPGRPPLVDRVRRRTLTHTGRAVTATAGDADVQEVVACGRALPGYDIRVVGGRGAVLGERREGRVEFRGPSATRGYYRDPEATRTLYDGEWVDTGDLGYLAGGDVYLTGRSKDLIIRAGRNLHPEDLEDALGRLPGARRGCVAAFPATDPALGTERLVVAVETRAEEQPARDALRAAVVDTVVDLAGTPPDDVVLLAPHTVPKTSSGKIRRRACRDAYERGALAHPVRHERAHLVRLALSARLARVRAAARSFPRAAYAAYAWVLTAGIATASAVALWCAPVLRWRMTIARHQLRVLARLVGVPVRVSGTKRLPPGGAIVVANHASWIDGAVLTAALPGTPVFVVAHELAAKWWAGPLLRRLGVEFVHRATHEQGAADTQRLIAHARAGRDVVVFAEGELSPVEGLRPFRMGAFVTASDARVPIVPVAIRGTRRVLAPGHRAPRRGAIDVAIAEPITTATPGWPGAVELQRAARAAVLAQCGEPDIA